MDLLAPWVALAQQGHRAHRVLRATKVHRENKEKSASQARVAQKVALAQAVPLERLVSQDHKVNLVSQGRTENGDEQVAVALGVNKEREEMSAVLGQGDPPANLGNQDHEASRVNREREDHRGLQENKVSGLVDILALRNWSYLY